MTTHTNLTRGDRVAVHTDNGVEHGTVDAIAPARDGGAIRVHFDDDTYTTMAPHRVRRVR